MHDRGFASLTGTLPGQTLYFIVVATFSIGKICRGKLHLIGKWNARKEQSCVSREKLLHSTLRLGWHQQICHSPFMHRFHKAEGTSHAAITWQGGGGSVRGRQGIAAPTVGRRAVSGQDQFERNRLSHTCNVLNNYLVYVRGRSISLASLRQMSIKSC